MHRASRQVDEQVKEYDYGNDDQRRGSGHSDGARRPFADNLFYRLIFNRVVLWTSGIREMQGVGHRE